MKKRQEIYNDPFERISAEKFGFTNHFFDRWQERIPSTPFKEKRSMAKYLTILYRMKGIEHIDGDFYILDDYIVTASEKNNKNEDVIVFITIHGAIADNPILYNILISEGEKGVRRIHREYGKMNITPNYKK